MTNNFSLYLLNIGFRPVHRHGVRDAEEFQRLVVRRLGSSRTVTAKVWDFRPVSDIVVEYLDYPDRYRGHFDKDSRTPRPIDGEARTILERLRYLPR